MLTKEIPYSIWKMEMAEESKAQASKGHFNKSFAVFKIFMR